MSVAVMSGRERDPSTLSPREAWNRYVDRRRSESTQASLDTYHYRLKQFVEWCEAEGIETVGELNGWSFESFETYRSAEELAPTTIRGELQTLKNWIEYLERIEAVDDGLAEKIRVPTVPSGEESDETQLLPTDAIELLTEFRETAALYGCRRHAVLEILWFTGARMGGVRGIDRRDYSSSDEYLDFVHRPQTGTPLKNGLDGQRPVGLPPDVCDVLDRYVDHYRTDQYDEHDRQPLFTTRVGRMSRATVRSDCYMATFPCIHTDCPHGKDPKTCEYRQRDHSSKCPSSRSPHQVRTGSIRWQLDIGMPPEVVAERVNASLSTIKQHYDHATQHERMERRRRRFVRKMDLSLGPDAEDDSEP